MMKTSDGVKMPGRSRTSWCPEEDRKLKAYIKRYGICNWTKMPEAAGRKLEDDLKRYIYFY